MQLLAEFMETHQLITFFYSIFEKLLTREGTLWEDLMSLNLNSSPLSAAYRCQWTGSSMVKANTWTSAGLISIALLGLYFSEIWIRILTFLCKTRRNSMQSIGNMPPPSPRHLHPYVLQIMPQNPKYDQFQPKGHHNEENPQRTIKMPGNPKFDPFL